MKWFLSLFRSKPHKADAYFKQKLREPMSRDARMIVQEAKRIRHDYPNLDGHQLVHLVYWGSC
jgi:hypothetical protein